MKKARAKTERAKTASRSLTPKQAEALYWSTMSQRRFGRPNGRTLASLWRKGWITKGSKATKGSKVRLPEITSAGKRVLKAYYAAKRR